MSGAITRDGRSLHQVAVWNPQYTADSIDSHVRLLYQRAKAARDPENSTSESDVYVWWESIISRN